MQAEALPDDGHEHINRNSDPDVGFQGILAGTVERFDSQKVLDSSEEQFHLSAEFVNLRDGQCGKLEIVGEELEPLVGFGLKVGDAPQRIRVHFGGADRGQDDGVIG